MRIKSVLIPFVTTLAACLLVISLLTAIAPYLVTLPRPLIQPSFSNWMEEWEGRRFDDWADGNVLSNYIYRVLVPDFTFWIRFEPSIVPRHGWRELEFAVEPANQDKLIAAINAQDGDLQHRYWTGHLVATTALLALYRDMDVASRAARTLVLVALLLYLLAWQRNFGTVSAVMVGLILIGTGSVTYESFHDHVWGPALAMLTGVLTFWIIRRNLSIVIPAVVGGVFNCWIGYNYLFDTIAFSLPFFIQPSKDGFHVPRLAEPVLFTGTVFCVTAIMMGLRIPITLWHGDSLSRFFHELIEKTAYRMAGDFSKEDPIHGQPPTRILAFQRSLPIFEYYVFRLMGVLVPRLQHVTTYFGVQALPLIVMLGVLFRAHKKVLWETVKPVAVLGMGALLFHTMYLVFPNHACVHPYLDVRHMVFCLAIIWGVGSAVLIAYLATKLRRGREQLPEERGPGKTAE